MTATMEARGGNPSHGCHRGCIIRCSQHYVDKEGKYITSGFEYETIWGLGANSKIKDLDQIAYIDRAMDDVGVDSIETAVTIAVAMDAGVIPWGDGKAALIWLEQIGRNSAGPDHRLRRCSYRQCFGMYRVPAVKTRPFPLTIRVRLKVSADLRHHSHGCRPHCRFAVATNILRCSGFVEPLKKEWQRGAVPEPAIATAAVDSTGMCLFIAFAILDIRRAPSH